MQWGRRGGRRQKHCVTLHQERREKSKRGVSVVYICMLLGFAFSYQPIARL